MPPPSLSALPRVRDRISFLYAEHCVVHRDNNAFTLRDETGVVHVPATAISTFLFGPGTSVSHQAMTLIGQSGSSVAWTGENAVRIYASGRALSRSNRLLRLQAEKSTHQKMRLAVARRMYEMRFPDEDVSSLTMQQLRGKEGARVRRIYRDESERTGVEWTRRDYDPDTFDTGTLINQALSAANSCLYGIVHAAVIGLGMSPGLGFVHEGHDLSLLYDVADLYKAATSIPAAFEVVAAGADDIPSAVRREMRDRVFEQHLIQQAVADLQELMGIEQEEEEYALADVTTLWDLHGPDLAGGLNYAEEAL